MLTVLALNKARKKGEALAYSEDGEVCGGGRTLTVCPESSQDVSGQMRSPLKNIARFLCFQNEIQLLKQYMSHLLCRWIIPSLMKTPHELCPYEALKEFSGIKTDDFD